MHRFKDLGTQIFLAIILGIIFAIVNPSASLSLLPLGKAYVMLLQMPILFFMSCSIIVGVAQLTLKDAKIIFTYAVIFLALSWVITKLSIFLIPLGFPDLDSTRKFVSIKPLNLGPASIFETG